MSDLSVATHRKARAFRPLFQDVLGPQWDWLPPQIRALSAVWEQERLVGRAQVTRGSGFASRLVAAVFRVPAAGTDISVTVTKTQADGVEVWQRRFADQTFRSQLSRSPKPQHLFERFDPFTFELELAIDTTGAIDWHVRRGWFSRLPLPAALLPHSASREFLADGKFNFDVGLSGPLGIGEIVRYRGWLQPEGSPPISIDPPASAHKNP